jgi:hypothetical protein
MKIRESIWEALGEEGQKECRDAARAYRCLRSCIEEMGDYEEAEDMFLLPQVVEDISRHYRCWESKSLLAKTIGATMVYGGELPQFVEGK